MEITTLQIVLVFIVACIAGMGSILDEFQFHRPLIAYPWWVSFLGI